MHLPRSICTAPLAAIATLGACGGDGAAPGDAAGDAGRCGAESFFTGEIVDFDSSGTSFCGVFNAALTVRDEPTRTAKTNPNGRFELCMAHKAQTLVDVVPSTQASQCTNPSATYVVPAVLIAEQAVIDGGGVFSARMMTQDRMAKLYDPSTIGAYNPNQGQLVVHLVGPPRMVTINTPNHSAAQRFDGTSWAPGDTGSDVLFPNVDVTGGAIHVDVANGAIGATTLTLEPGKLTYLTVISK